MMAHVGPLRFGSPAPRQRLSLSETPTPSASSTMLHISRARYAGQAAALAFVLSSACSKTDSARAADVSPVTRDTRVSSSPGDVAVTGATRLEDSVSKAADKARI